MIQRFDEADSERKKDSEEKNSKRDFLAEKSEREHELRKEELNLPTETRNRESNSTNTECPVRPVSPTFYATAAMFVNNGDVPEILLTVKPETKL